MKNLIFIFTVLALVSGCNGKSGNASLQNNHETEAESNIAALQLSLDSIATEAQKVLLQNVAEAIKIGGTEYAVSFCNENAIPLLDSVSAIHNISIQRISNKNRNPNNYLKTAEDKNIFEAFSANSSLKDSLVSVNNHYVYYKRINAAMPTCLKCHGNIKTDIEEKTLAKIQLLYPADKASGYALNDFRGLWKIIAKH